MNPGYGRQERQVPPGTPGMADIRVAWQELLAGGRNPMAGVIVWQERQRK